MNTARIEHALNIVGLSCGVKLTPERQAAIVTILAQSGLSLERIERACLDLCTCPEFDDKVVRYKGAFTAADVVRKAQNTTTTEPGRKEYEPPPRQIARHSDGPSVLTREELDDLLQWAPMMTNPAEWEAFETEHGTRYRHVEAE